MLRKDDLEQYRTLLHHIQSHKFNRMSVSEQRLSLMHKYNEQCKWLFTKKENAISRNFLSKKMLLCLEIVDGEYYHSVVNPTVRHLKKLHFPYFDDDGNLCGLRR